jgi:hypothetical protein
MLGVVSRVHACVRAATIAAAFAPGVAAAAQQAAPATEPAARGPARLPGVEVTTAKRVRHDWFLGFGLAVGVGNVRLLENDAVAAGPALTGVLRAGGRVTDRVLLGALAVTSFGGTKAAVVGFSNLLAEGLFFPIQGRGLGLSAGLGLSSAWTQTAGTVTPGERERARVGVGFSAGVGWDFWLARRFNLGVWLRVDGSAGPKYGFRGTGTLGLAFSFY